MAARSTLSRSILVVSTLVLFVAALPPATAHAEAKRHHISLALGYQKFVSDDLDDSGFEDSGLGGIAYRYSVSPSVDVVFDSRGTVSSQDALFDFGGTFVDANLDYMTEWYGPGVRYNFKPEGTRPYVQANLYVATERLKAEVSGVDVSDSETGVGVGLQAGVDIRLSKLLSLPVEMNFMTGSPDNDLTSVGGAVGLTFNFGKF